MIQVYYATGGCGVSWIEKLHGERNVGERERAGKLKRNVGYSKYVSHRWSVHILHEWFVCMSGA